MILSLERAAEDLDQSAEYTPENLRELAGKIRDFRADILFALDDAGSDPESEQYYLLSLNALEQADRYMRLAAIKQSQGIAR